MEQKKLDIEVGAVVTSYENGVVTFSNGYSLKVGKVAKKKPEKLVSVFAFTGMRLGELEVVKETETELEVKRGDGKKLVFDKTTGLQTNCKNPRFANRIAL